MGNVNFSTDLLKMMRDGVTPEDLASQLAGALAVAENAYKVEQEEARKKAEAERKAKEAETAKEAARQEFAKTYVAALRTYFNAIGIDTSTLDEPETMRSIAGALDFLEACQNLLGDLNITIPKAEDEQKFWSRRKNNSSAFFNKSDEEKVTNFLSSLFPF